MLRLAFSFFWGEGGASPPSAEETLRHSISLRMGGPMSERQYQHRALEREGVDADSKGKYDRTPLLWAAANGYEVIVQLLLKYEGIDADSKDRYGQAPLWWDMKNGHEVVVRLTRPGLQL
jgi:ankyrin repeat protein